jgi:hypothetical protein
MAIEQQKGWIEGGDAADKRPLTGVKPRMVLGFGNINAFWRKFSAPVGGFKRKRPAVVITAGLLLRN